MPQQKIIRASKQNEDDLHIELEKQQERSNIESVPVHQKCVDRYCHKTMHEKHKAQVLKMLWPNLREQGNQNSNFFHFFSIVSFVEENVIL